MQPIRYWTSPLLIVLIGLLVSSGAAQERMSDKDVEATMKNLKEDAKKFRKTFDSAVGKSTIRKTSQEKGAKALSQRFEKETENMLNQFKNTKKADTTLPAVLSTSNQLQKVIEGAGISSQVNPDWTRVHTSLDKLSNEFNVPKNSSPM